MTHAPEHENDTVTQGSGSLGAPPATDQPGETKVDTDDPGMVGDSKALGNPGPKDIPGN